MVTKIMTGDRRPATGEWRVAAVDMGWRCRVNRWDETADSAKPPVRPAGNLGRACSPSAPLNLGHILQKSPGVNRGSNCTSLRAKRSWWWLSGLDGDALYLHALDGGAVLAATAGGESSDLLEHGVTGSDLTECGVLPIEETGIAVADKKLATGAVGVGGASHGEHTAHVRLLVELGIELVSGITGAGHAACAFFGVRAAALDHEALDDAVEGRAIIETVTGKFFEVLDGFRGHIGPEGNSHVAVSRGDDGDFVGGGFSAHKGTRIESEGRFGQACSGVDTGDSASGGLPALTRSRSHSLRFSDLTGGWIKENENENE